MELLRHPGYLLAMGFGTGLAPVAPGTVGTALALLLYLPLSLLPPAIYASVVVIMLGIGILVCGHMSRSLGLKDPAIVVWDEFVGTWIACFMLPAGWYWLIACFFVFRFFDIVKPWPASWFDRHISGGLGIMMDDVMAGFYALAVLQLAHLGVSSM